MFFSVNFFVVVVIKSKLDVFGLTPQSIVGICAAILEISKQTQKKSSFFTLKLETPMKFEICLMKQQLNEHTKMLHMLVFISFR